MIIKMERYKRSVISFILFFCLCSTASAASLNKLIAKEKNGILRIVLEISEPVKYTVNKGNSYITIIIPDLKWKPFTAKSIKSRVLESLKVEEKNNACIIRANFKYLTSSSITNVKAPSRLVVEFRQLSKMTIPKMTAPEVQITEMKPPPEEPNIGAKDIFTGLRYLKLNKNTEKGPVTVNVLIADQHILKVFPYVAQKKEEMPNILGIIGSFFTFWNKEEQTKFYRDKVSNMVLNTDAVAGINGTFFGKIGEPLGVLMMNGELISYSINDRTALIIEKNNHCFIDNVSLSGESSIEGAIVQLTGINNKRQVGEAVVYTPRYGSETDEDGPGIVLSVIGDEVKNISRARAWIPKDGYALSLDPNYYITLKSRIKIGSRIHTTLKLIPLSGIANLEIKDVIGGGPRLLKSGQVYISRNSERFKRDIAKSRAARTAVGINKDGKLVFATVDQCDRSARSQKSVGATLEELAQIMKDLGCVDAMNLDGGSSSTMVLISEVMNVPSGGAEKPVSNGILIKK